MKNMRLVLIFPVLIVLNACGYSQNYHSFNAPPELIALHRSGPAPETPRVEHVDDITMEVIDSYMKEGFLAIGYSDFTSSGIERESNAISKGRSLGVDLVVIAAPKFSGSTQTTVPVMTPVTSTTVSNYGYATTYGSVPVYYDMNFTYYNYKAVYMVSMRHIFGVIPKELSDDQKQEIKSNMGVAVKLVVKNSPAFMADILPGDIITAIDGYKIQGMDDFGQTVNSLSGQQVAVEINRFGNVIEKAVKFGM